MEESDLASVQSQTGRRDATGRTEMNRVQKSREPPEAFHDGPRFEGDLDLTERCTAISLDSRSRD